MFGSQNQDREEQKFHSYKFSSRTPDLIFVIEGVSSRRFLLVFLFDDSDFSLDKECIADNSCEASAVVLVS